MLIRHDKMREWKLGIEEVFFIEDFSRLTSLLSDGHVLHDGEYYFQVDTEKILKSVPAYKSKNNFLAIVKRVCKKNIFKSVLLEDGLLLICSDIKLNEWISA